MTGDKWESRGLPGYKARPRLLWPSALQARACRQAPHSPERCHPSLDSNGPGETITPVMDAYRGSPQPPVHHQLSKNAVLGFKQPSLKSSSESPARVGLGPTSLFFQVRMKPAGRAGGEREAEGAGQRSKSTAGLGPAGSSAELWKALCGAVSRRAGQLSLLQASLGAWGGHLQAEPLPLAPWPRIPRERERDGPCPQGAAGRETGHEAGVSLGRGVQALWEVRPVGGRS